MSESSFGIPGGGDASPNGSGFLPPGLESTPTGSEESNYQQVLDGAADRSRQETAQHLADRRAQKNAGQYESVQSVDLEVQLQNAQLELHNARKGNYSFAQISQLEQRAQALAEQLVTGQAGGVPQQDFESSVDQNDDAPDSYEGGINAAEELNGLYSPDVVESTLQWAATGLDQTTAEAFNAALAANDENSIAAFQQLQQLKNNPELIANEESFSQVSPELVNELTDQYGEAGKKLGLLSYGIASGKLTRGKAAQMVMADQELAQAAMAAARQGLITLAL